MKTRLDGWASWRAERLRRAGFPESLADRVADQREIDVHAVLELLDRGCPPELAVRILAPLEAEAPVDRKRRP